MKSTTTAALFQLAISLAAGLVFSPVHAQTDIADAPLSNMSSDEVKPNVLFILDDSGSMGWDYMPDSRRDPSDAVGYRNHYCNTVFYNPETKYTTPRDYLNADLNASTPTAFTSAHPNGFYCYTDTTSAAAAATCGIGIPSRTNLSTSFRANSSDTSQPAYYWSYLGAATLNPESSSECDTTVKDGSGSMTSVNEICTDNSRQTGTCAGVGKTALWRKIIVSTTSGPASSDERQNFANWYSYYRNRLNMMKASTSRAFETLTSTYRIGFITINATISGPVTSSRFLKVDDFSSVVTPPATTSHRQEWFGKLYSQEANSRTPLRHALSVAGRYFAGKNDQINSGMVPTAADDPVQYSCQQNFSILTTDGYWNDGDGKLLNGTTTMTNQDGVLSELDAYNATSDKFAVSPRPIFDGASTQYTLQTAANEYRNTSTCVLSSSPSQRSVQYQQCSAPGDIWTRTSANRGGTWTAWSLVSSCTRDTSGSSRRDCLQREEYRDSSDRGVTWTDWAEQNPNDGSCSPDGSGSTRKECRDAYGCLSSGTWSNARCTNTDPSRTPLCRSNPGPWASTSSCTATSQDGSGVAIECDSVDTLGNFVEYRTITTTTSYTGPGGTGSVIAGPTTSNGSWTPKSIGCYASGDTNLDLPDPNPEPVTGSGPPSPPGSCSAWPCETATAGGGSSNTLSDVAQYYYKTDLRTSALGNCTGALGADVCENNVPTTGTRADLESDLANWQHMTTFTMGLGLSGTLIFDPNYKSGAGDFAALRAGSKGWPVPAANDRTTLDDLWHAAVNGRGLYFSADSPDSVVSGLNKTLAGVSARVGSGAAAATSNLEPVAGDNFIYTPKYVTRKWVGDLEAHSVDLTTGVVSSDVIWSAQAKLDTKSGSACDNRVLKLFREGATNNLVDFTWNTFACDSTMSPTGLATTGLNLAEQAYFSATSVANLSQYPQMTDGSSGATNQRAAAEGSVLLNFVRGQRGKEGFTIGNDSENALFRSREHILGDIVNSQPLFIQGANRNYADTGYSDYVTAQKNRAPMLYVAANDGFLHAIAANIYTKDGDGNNTTTLDPAGGTEAWAFMPSMVLPNVYKLANSEYADGHNYYVDGTPVRGDACDASTTPCTWKTLLVGGLNKGGKGYYALDVTDPGTPKALWEFKWSSTCYNAADSTTFGADCDLGYTYGKPIIAKLRDQTWAVFVTSGYNNSSGRGYLYVLNAMTGKIMYKIGTGVGTPTAPSGLSQITAWADNPSKNATAVRVYGTDLLGNLWRFDVNDNFPDGADSNGREATLVATVVDNTGKVQPITTMPMLADYDNDGTPIILLGTGRYLGVSDVSNRDTQSIWGIVDHGVRSPTTATPIATPRTTLSEITLANNGSGSSAYRTLTCGDRSSSGWYLDLPDSGERVNVDPKLQLGTLVVASNVPVTNACNIGGYSWLNYVNFKTGCTVDGTTDARAGDFLAEALAVGLNVVRLPEKTVVITSTSDANVRTLEGSFATASPEGKRTSWREIIQ